MGDVSSPERPIRLRLRVVLVMHYSELGRHLGSNTAKLLLHFGAELLCWGLKEHDAKLLDMLAQDPEGAAVLFPGPHAVAAGDVAVGTATKRLRSAQSSVDGSTTTV